MSQIGRPEANDKVPLVEDHTPSVNCDKLFADTRAESIGMGTQSLNADRQKLDRDIKFERKEKHMLLAALNRMQGENSALRLALDPAYALSDEVSIMANNVSAQAARIDSLCESMRLVIASWGDLNVKLRAWMDSQERSSKTLDNTISEIGSALKRLEAKVEVQDDQVLDLLVQQQKILSQILHSEQDDTASSRNAAERLQMVLTSRSWRLTRPLRALWGLFNREC